MTNNFIFQGQVRRKGEKIRPDGTPVESIWVTGNGVFIGENDYAIIYHIARKGNKLTTLVYSDTVRQYIGINDKNGKMIFKGDIIRCKDYHGDRFGIVDYCAGTYYLSGADGYSDEYIFNESDKEVIGNIWDNPELLEEKKCVKTNS